MATMATGISLAGVLTTGLLPSVGISNDEPNGGAFVLLSDSIPAESQPTAPIEMAVTAELDQALRAAHLSAVTVVDIL